MYSTNGEKQSLDELQTFEQVRYFFLQKNGAKIETAKPARIIAFRSEKEYAPYRLNGGAFAFYERTPKCDYIVMQDINPEHHAAAIHEYTHLIFSHAGLNFPIWLNEGLADLYSSLESHGTQAIIGRALPDRVYTLINQPWIPLDVLFAVDRNSPYYNESQRMSIFYAESWALTHMLQFGDGYAQGFNKFLTDLIRGTSSSAALTEAFGKNSAQVYADLRAYTRRNTLKALIYNIHLQKTDLNPQISEPSDFEIELTLADLLASSSARWPEAQRSLQALSSKNPQSPDPEDSLRYLAWQQGDTARARSHFAAAVARGSKDVQMLSDYAMLENSGGSPAKAISLFQKALALKPDDYDIRLHLGLIAFNQKKTGLALTTLAGLKQVKAADAFPVFLSLGYVYMQFKDDADARGYAEKALRYASNPEQRNEAQTLVDYMSRRNLAVSTPLTPVTDEPISAHPDFPAPASPAGSTLPSVHGIAKSFECLNKNARLHLQVGSREMIFDLGNPDSIIVRNKPNGVVEWSCGPLKPEPITVVFDPSVKKTGSEGLIRQLIF